MKLAAIALLTCASVYAANLDDSANLNLSPEEVKKAWAIFDYLQATIVEQRAKINALEMQLKDVEARKCI